jgi:hypothetical protein
MVAEQLIIEELTHKMTPFKEDDQEEFKGGRYAGNINEETKTAAMNTISEV